MLSAREGGREEAEEGEEGVRERGGWREGEREKVGGTMQQSNAMSKL